MTTHEQINDDIDFAASFAFGTGSRGVIMPLVDWSSCCFGLLFASFVVATGSQPPATWARYVDPFPAGPENLNACLPGQVLPRGPTSAQATST